jgi:hypothetical protein
MIGGATKKIFVLKGTQMIFYDKSDYVELMKAQLAKVRKLSGTIIIIPSQHSSFLAFDFEILKSI